MVDFTQYANLEVQILYGNHRVLHKALANEFILNHSGDFIACKSANGDSSEHGEIYGSVFRNGIALHTCASGIDLHCGVISDIPCRIGKVEQT